MQVYKITNTINGDFYIGKTIYDTKRRLRGHRNSATAGSNYYIHNAMRYYGVDNFSIETIEDDIQNEDILNEREIYWIEKLNPKYNMHKGGQGGSKKGRPDICGESRERWLQNWYKLGQTPWNKGKTGLGGYKHSKPMSMEKRQKISLSRKNSKVKCEHCGFITNDANYGKYHGNNCFDKGKLWKLTNKKTNEVVITDNIRQFCEIRNLKRRGIQQVLTGKNSHHFGWVPEIIN